MTTTTRGYDVNFHIDPRQLLSPPPPLSTTCSLRRVQRAATAYQAASISGVRASLPSSTHSRARARTCVQCETRRGETRRKRASGSEIKTSLGWLHSNLTRVSKATTRRRRLLKSSNGRRHTIDRALQLVARPTRH